MYNWTAINAFLSTPSAKRATRRQGKRRGYDNDFYPRPPRRGRRAMMPGKARPRLISIHALREEGDCTCCCVSMPDTIFLSTPSAKRATLAYGHLYHPQCYFYPRPPRRGRPCAVLARVCAARISIHALREEGDRPFGNSPRQQPVFLSTPSAKRATRRRVQAGQGVQAFLSTPSAKRATSKMYRLRRLLTISIHALREEGDNLYTSNSCQILYFYPRPPRGGRLR